MDFRHQNTNVNEKSKQILRFIWPDTNTCNSRMPCQASLHRNSHRRALLSFVIRHLIYIIYRTVSD